MTHSRIPTTVDHNMLGSPPQPDPSCIDRHDDTVPGGSPVKALSITRPWTTLILHHGKTIENRTWSTGYRGLLILHAAKSWDPAALAWAERIGVVDAVSWYPREHPTGIIGVAHLVDICSTSHTGPVACNCGPWAMPGQYHWQLRTPVALGEPIPARGKLGPWTPSPELAAQVAAALGGDRG